MPNMRRFSEHPDSEHPEDWLVSSCFHQVTKYNVEWKNGECWTGFQFGFFISCLSLVVVHRCWNRAA